MKTIDRVYVFCNVQESEKNKESAQWLARMVLRILFCFVYFFDLFKY